MFNRKQRRPSLDLSPGSRLRQNLVDHFADGGVSAQRMASFMADASRAGVESCDGRSFLAEAPQAKSVRRALMHDSNWPELYEHPLPIVKPDGHTIEEQPCQFLLPHEVIEKLFNLGNAQCLLSTDGLDDPSKAKLDSICEEWETHNVLPISLWGDGVPVNWDRTESIFMYTWGLPGLATSENVGLRVPITAIPKEMCLWGDPQQNLAAHWLVS